MALAAYNIMKARNRTNILIGGVDAMPPAIQAVSEGRMFATVRNPSCRIHGGAIVAGVAAVVGGEKSGQGIPKNVDRRSRRTKTNAPGMQWMEDHFLTPERHAGRPRPRLNQITRPSAVSKPFVGRLRASCRRDPWSRRRERAGKSTLMKIIAGVHPGSPPLHARRNETRFRSTRDAHAAGIGMVHQELSVAPDLTVAENVFLGNQPTNRLGVVQWRRMAREAGEQLSRFGIDVDPMTRLGDLPIGLQQLIEIARVLFSGARIIILDEPTSALSPPEVERLFATLHKLRDQGTSIVFISHFIEDILRVSDVVTVFRNGRKIAAQPPRTPPKPR